MMVPHLDYPPHELCSLRPGYRGTSLQSFYAAFPSEESCLRHVLDCSAMDLSQCRRCGKRAKLYPIKGTRRFQYPCGHTIHPMTNTILNRTNIPVQLWFYAMLHFSNSAEGVNSLFLSRHLGIASKAAFRMGQRIRLQMAALERLLPFAEGSVVDIRLERLRGIRVIGRSKTQVVNVLFLSDGSRATSVVVPGKPRRHILNGILASLAPNRAECVTTCYLTYRASSEWGSRPPLAQFRPGYFLEQDSRKDLISGLNGYCRKPLNYHYRRVNRENLWAYLKEFEFRFNRRHASENIFWDLVAQFPDLSDSAVGRLAEMYTISQPGTVGA